MSQYAQLSDLQSSGLAFNALQSKLSWSQVVQSTTTGGTGTGAGSMTPSNPTGSPNPLVSYQLLVQITTPGALGAAQFQYSLNGGMSFQGPFTVPANGVYTIPATGVILTFAGTGAAFVLNDTYSSQILAGDITTALVKASGLVDSYLQAKWSSIMGSGNTGLLIAWGDDITLATVTIAAWYILKAQGYNPKYGADVIVRAGYEDYVGNGKSGSLGWLDKVAQGMVTPQGFNNATIVNESTPQAMSPAPSSSATQGQGRGWAGGGYGYPQGSRGGGY